MDHVSLAKQPQLSPHLRQDVAVVRRMRGHPRWLQLGVGSGLIGLALVALSLLSLIVFGPSARDAGSTASLFFGFGRYGWTLASAITAPANHPDRGLRGRLRDRPRLISSKARSSEALTSGRPSLTKVPAPFSPAARYFSRPGPRITG